MLASKYLLAEVRCPDPRPNRQRIIDEAMRLFGEQGYAATTIEAAAGLFPGSGSLYRHYPTKHALLTRVRQQIAAGEELLSFIADPTSFATQALPERLFGQDPAGITQDRYVAALAELALGLVDDPHEEPAP
jgi:AcrR family transcriptional regulator